MEGGRFVLEHTVCWWREGVVLEHTHELVQAHSSGVSIGSCYANVFNVEVGGGRERWSPYSSLPTTVQTGGRE